jgi:hypothetical protein
MIRLILFLYLSTISSHSYAVVQDVKRFALVIGNKNYAIAPLKNSANDATAIADSLTDMGFRVSLLKDSNLSDITTQVQQFYARVKKEDHVENSHLFIMRGMPFR